MTVEQLLAALHRERARRAVELSEFLDEVESILAGMSLP